MRTLKFLLQKEFKQIFRNRAILPLIFVVPVVQLLILPLAADYEVKNINISVVDGDHSTNSRQLIAKITSSGYFRLTGYGTSFDEAYGLMESDDSDLILEIPAGFERNLVREGEQKVFVAVNAINGVKASLGGAYLMRIISNYNDDIRLDWIQKPRFNPSPQIEVTSSNWFNPHLDYNFFMVPAILVILVTMVGSYLCALNIVKEKEMGTIEQINVTPIRKYQFVLGKLIPFWVIAMFVFTLGLFVVAYWVYGIVPLGSWVVLYSYLAVYLIAMLGLGLLISTFSETQQQAMSISFFFMMIFMLMSGLFTPIDGMPEWAYVIARSNPVTYCIEVVRMVVLKGSGFNDLKQHFLITAVFAVALNSFAIWNYKKTS
ncbi:MAG: ABC transporter permease [Saprospiraceae bacterium]|jgi:ABC-2 type transport system permease protein|nr:ABC transporter permease [Candidatus Parvibacillus calidus]MBX2937384.1 ABC transporter permease [Saprospiraceae bacterium]MBX7179206.1 ABC transporter permease [Saprospiraceae bacterium]MCB0591705.1 ABC transporter permease [Saprospiraceae bacterium]MCC7149776.1 ABC transporter permease [Saprospiraceae bacterium]